MYKVIKFYCEEISLQLLEKLSSLLHRNFLLKQDDLNMTALIVPAFETQRYRIAFPKSKVKLIELLQKQEIFTFRYHLYTKAHSPTNYTRWQTANTTYQVHTNYVQP